MRSEDMDKWTRVAATLAVAMTSACVADDPNLRDELAVSHDDDSARPGAAAEALTTTRHARAVPGFEVGIDLAGEDVVIDWSGSPVNGCTEESCDIQFVVYRAEDARALLEIGIDGPAGPGVTELAVDPGTRVRVDLDAASQSVPTPHYYYRVGAWGNEGLRQLSTMVMKTTTATGPGFNKLGLCMIDAPPDAQAVHERFGDGVIRVWGWDPVAQSFVGWAPGDPDRGFSLELGQVVVAEFDESAPSFSSLVGIVPTDETFAVSGQPGRNWGTLPPLYSEPEYASYWVQEGGYYGVGYWDNLAQDAIWYWDDTYDDIAMESCRGYYFELPGNGCADNTDCSDGSFCHFVEAAACGEQAAGLCFPSPISCEANEPDPVCGCDGQDYDNSCEAAAAGVSVDHPGGCITCESWDDFEDVHDNLVLEMSGSWGLFTQSPMTLSAPEVTFGSQVLGTDGNRVAPYPGSEAETSAVTLGPLTLDRVLSFRSWHVDEGGSSYDRKRIVFEPDDGDAPSVLVDCGADEPELPAFCTFDLSSRAGDDWDSIVLDTTALAGRTGNLRLEYDTVDGCCSSERGWYIDDLTLGDCETPGLPEPEPPEEPCPEGTVDDGDECRPLEVSSVGGLSTSAILGPYFRSNGFVADADGWLSAFDHYLGLSGPCELDFYVLESDTPDGDLALVWQQTVTADAGTGYYSSGAIDVPVSAGTYYALGIGWNCVATYYWDNSADWSGYDMGVGTFANNRWDNEYPGPSDDYRPTNVGSALTAYPQQVYYYSQ